MKYKLILFFIIIVGTLPPQTQSLNADKTPLDKFSQLELDPFPSQRGLSAEHYPASNEDRIDLFRPYLQNLGGGYLGVGTDQNLVFVAWARSRYAWLIDFDPVSVNVNKIHIFFLKQAPTYPEFYRLWKQKKSLKLLKTRFKGSGEYRQIRRAWRIARRGWNDVPGRLRSMKKLTRNFGLNSFHNNPDDYTYLRTLALDGRITAVSGNLLGKKTIRSIANAARGLGINIRLTYTSNAEDYFKGYKKNFRENIKALPVDDQSLIIRTVSYRARSWGYPLGEKFPSHPLHYNIQPINNLKHWMIQKKRFSIITLMRNRTTIKRGLSRIEKLPKQLKPKRASP